MADILDMPSEAWAAMAEKGKTHNFRDGSQLVVFRDPNHPNRLYVLRVNFHGGIEDRATMKVDPHLAYRWVRGAVIPLPVVEEDGDPLRRWLRENGHSIRPDAYLIYVSRGQRVRVAESPSNPRDDGYRAIRDAEPPIKLVSVDTARGRRDALLVVKGEEPKTYEELLGLFREVEEEAERKALAEEGRYW